MRSVGTLVVSVVLSLGLIQSPVPAAQAKPSPGKSMQWQQTIQSGRAATREAMKQTGASSISVAVLHKGDVIWSQGFGVINKKGDKPTGTTKYGIGSVSKMVTTLAVMQLVDAGKIQLDAPVVRYLPAFTMLSPQYRQITVRMLLNHTAGLPGSDYANGFSFEPIAGYPEQVLEALSKSRLKTTPGAMNVYCNDCFTLAGEVVARASNSSFEDYVRTHIFKPLGMTHSGFSPDNLPRVAPVIEDGKPAPLLYTNIAASGGIVSTPRDMLRLAEVFTGQRKGLVSPQLIAMMGTDQTTTTMKVGPASDLRYGLGWDDVQAPALHKVGVTTWVKGGDVAQHHAGFAVAPDEDLAVMVLGAGWQLDSGTAETVAEKILLSAVAETGTIKRYPKQVSGVPAVDRASAADLKRMSGIYLGSGISLRLKPVSGSGLKMSVLEQGKWVARPGRYVLRRDGAFWNAKSPGTSVRLKKAWGRTYLLRRSIGGTGTYYTSLPLGQRVRSATTLTAWSQRVGQKWLLANEHPASLNWESPVLRFTAIPGLRGYLLADGIGSLVPFDAGADPSVGTMFLQVPLAVGRDLNEYEVSAHGGEDMLQFGSIAMRQAATVPALAKGAIVVGSRGFVEWARVDADTTVTLSGQSDWKVFNAEFVLVDSGGSAEVTVALKAGTYVALFGAPGTVISLN